jgi:hypothetical protein
MAAPPEELADRLLLSIEALQSGVIDFLKCPLKTFFRRNSLFIRI